MTRANLSKMVLVLGIILWALCAKALRTSSGRPGIAKMICTTTDFAEKLSTSLLDGDPHAFNITMYHRGCEEVVGANNLELNPMCSEGSFRCVYHVAKDKKQDGAEIPLLVCRHKQKKKSVKGGAVYIFKRKDTTTRIFCKEGPQLLQAWHGEDSICQSVIGVRDSSSNVPSSVVLSGKIRSVAKDDLVQTAIKEAVISDLPKSHNHALEAVLMEGAQIRKRDSELIREPLLICTPLRGLSELKNISHLVRGLFNRTTSKFAVLGDHVERNNQLEEFSSLHHGRQFSPWLRGLLQAATRPVAAQVVSLVMAPAPSPEQFEWVPWPAPVPAPTVITPPPPKTSPPPPPYKGPPPPPTMSPPPPYQGPPPPPKTSSPPPPLQPIFFLSPPSPPPPSPPTVYLNIPPGGENLLQPAINAPDTYNIANVSVYITGVDITFINITPSSILFLNVAALQRRSDHVVELPRVHIGRQNPGRVRRLFQAVPTPVISSRTYIKTSTAWAPKTTGVSTQLLLFLQVDAGSLVMLLPGNLLQNAKHQPTMADEWVAIMNSSDPWVWVPGAGIQFLGTVAEINDALSTLMFGLGLGTGKGRTVTLLVWASHTFQNLSSITQSQATKSIELQVAGAGAWFTIFTYTKSFYQSSVGVLCFFALLLILLCCILGCCVCHDAKMEKVFQQNKTVLKAQSIVYHESRVFNPVWIPSAPVLAGRGKFVVKQNPKYLQQRLAEHLSSLHGAVVEKVVTVLDLRRGIAEETFGLKDDGSDSDASMWERQSKGSASVSGADSSDSDSASSQSTHYTIKDDKRLGSPLSGRAMSPGSDSTHYDIGSPGNASGSDETESVKG